MHYIWVFIEKLGIVFIKLIALMVFARLISPEYFGAIALANTFVMSASLLIDGGFGGALINKTVIHEKDYNTAFVTNIIIALVCTFILFVLSGYLERFFSIDGFATIIQISSVALIFRAGVISVVTMQTKKMQFKKQTVIIILSQVVSFIAAVTIYYLGFGYWSLVWFPIFESIITFFLFVLSSEYRPKISFCSNSFKSLYTFGVRMMAANFIRTSSEMLVNFLISKSFGAGSLGYYSQANKIKEMCSGIVGAVIDKVSVPSLINARGSRESFWNIHVSLLGFYMFFSSLITLLIIINADILVKLLLGDDWLESVWLLKMLMLVFNSYVLDTLLRNALKSHGLANKVLNVELTKRLLALPILILSALVSFEFLMFVLVTYSLLSATFNLISIKINLKIGAWHQVKVLLPSLCALSLSLLCDMLISKSPILSNLALIPLFVLFVFILDKLLGNKSVKDCFVIVWK